MFTDSPPRKKYLQRFLDSDLLQTLPLPNTDELTTVAGAIAIAIKAGDVKQVSRSCDEFLIAASEFYRVASCTVRVFAARPLRVRERSRVELFGDYHADTKAIRVWMRTAIRKDLTSFGTFLSTLCHEFCHHLDLHRFGFCDSWHTRGFYQRAAVLYHHATGTPVKKLVWVPVGRQRWRIDCQATRRIERTRLSPGSVQPSFEPSKAESFYITQQ
jgi:hypothetical protein